MCQGFRLINDVDMLEGTASGETLRDELVEQHNIQLGYRGSGAGLLHCRGELCGRDTF